MKFFRWLAKKEAEKIPERVDNGDIQILANSTLVEKINEVENDNGSFLMETPKLSKTIDKKKFIDGETGKVYKTEKTLKAAITRRLKKARKND